MHDEKTDTMEAAMDTLAIIHYITIIEGKQYARAVIHEWLRRTDVRDEKLRDLLLQYIDSIDTPTAYEDATTGAVSTTLISEPSESYDIQFPSL